MTAGSTAARYPVLGTTRPPAGLAVIMVGLLLSQLVGNMNATIVTTALPTIIGDLGGTPVQYVWVMTATVLGMAASTPIWSRLADIRSPKLLMQFGIVLFVIGGLGAGFAQSAEMLIAFRAITGIGLGGMVSLVQVIIALLVPPRTRGRYTAWLSAVQLVATVSGPVIGGLLVEAPVLGWRLCFLFGVPVAIVAAIVLQRTLRLDARSGRTAIDYAGAVLITSGTALVLGWTSLAQTEFAVLSWPSLAMAGGGVLVLAVAVVVESRGAAPILPIRKLVSRVSVVAIVASVAVGSTMFGGSIFVIQYLQAGRGLAPAASGLVLVAVAVGTAAASFLVAWIASRTGRLKSSLVVGMGLLAVANGLLATLDAQTPLALVTLYLLLDGLAIGATAQYLVLAVQNSVGVDDVGAVSGAVLYFRSLGGALALSALGGLLSARLAALQASGLGEAAAYSIAVPTIFVVTFVVALIGFVAVLALPRIRLRQSVDVTLHTDQEFV